MSLLDEKLANHNINEIIMEHFGNDVLKQVCEEIYNDYLCSRFDNKQFKLVLNILSNVTYKYKYGSV